MKNRTLTLALSTITLLTLQVASITTSLAVTPTLPQQPPAIGGTAQDEVSLDEKPAQHRKSLHQILCVESYKGKSVTCFESTGDGQLRRWKDRRLGTILRKHQLFGSPLVFISEAGRLGIGYLSSRRDGLALFPLDLLNAPQGELTRQPWWTDFWYALDDAYWLEFERETLSLYSPQFEPGVLQAFRNLAQYEVLPDHELDASFTFGKVLEGRQQEAPAKP